MEHDLRDMVCWTCCLDSHCVNRRERIAALMSAAAWDCLDYIHSLAHEIAKPGEHWNILEAIDQVAEESQEMHMMGDDSLINALDEADEAWSFIAVLLRTGYFEESVSESCDDDEG